jgi:hypothetical protein
MSDVYEAITYGTNRKPLRYGNRDAFMRVRWASGTIQIFDALTGEALPGFAAPVVCEVSPDDVWLQWWPAYGDGAGQMRAIEAETDYLVQWEGVDIDGGHELTERFPWTLRAG